jgi:formyltetrahydrofolate hydrolase
MKFFFDTMTLLVVSNLSIRAVTTRGLSYLFTNAFTLEASPRLHHSTTLRNTSRQSTRLHSTSEKARILFLGTPEVAATSLQTIVESSRRDENSPYEIVGVVTQPPKRRKRRGKEEQSPVGLIATELDIPILTPEKAKDDAFLTSLENEFKPDLCITAAYGQYLPKRFLKIPKFGTLNIHPSLLPRWRGASPVQRSLEAGDNPVGVTVLFTGKYALQPFQFLVHAMVYISFLTIHCIVFF